MTFDVEGDCVGLLGPNGAGKSTLLSLLTGALPLQSGSLLPGREGGQLGYVPQDLRIDPSLTVEQFLAYCAWLKKLPRAGWGLQISRVLELTDVQDRRSARVGSLSGGLLRRVALAQALLGQPSMIVLDEPTNALDPGQRHAPALAPAGGEADGGHRGVDPSGGGRGRRGRCDRDPGPGTGGVAGPSG